MKCSLIKFCRRKFRSRKGNKNSRNTNKVEIRKLLARPNFRGRIRLVRRRTKPGSLTQSAGAVRALPCESRAGAPEVSISRGRLVNRPTQVQRLNNSLGRQREKFADQLGDFLF